MAGKIDYKLYLVTDDAYLDACGMDKRIEAALQAGVSVVQYRAKNRSGRAMLAEAVKLKALCASFNVPLIINDRLDIALATEADGLHLGQNDLPLAVARKLLPGKIIGVSASNYDEGYEAIKQGADYIGVGPLFQTSTKLDAQPPCGTETIVRLKAEFPAVCLVGIGGIDLKNAVQVIKAGADGLAAVSAILGSDDVALAVAQFKTIWSAFGKEES